jgi:hypothetical protein
MGESEKDEINSLVQRFSLEERIHLNPLAGGILDDDDLNLLYNACDVGINTSMGEGLGLVSFEHGAAGAAQIVPAHSACAELWDKRAEMIQPARNYTPEFSVLEMGEVSAEGVAHALNNLYYNPQHRQHLAQARLRAAEEGIPVIRSTPTGISAVVNARGGVDRSLPWRTAGAIDWVLPLPAVAPTPFARLGNIIPLALGFFLLIAAIVLDRRRRYRHRRLRAHDRGSRRGQVRGAAHLRCQRHCPPHRSAG